MRCDASVDSSDGFKRLQSNLKVIMLRFMGKYYGQDILRFERSMECIVMQMTIRVMGLRRCKVTIHG